MEPEVLYEDNHLLVVNKRPSDIVQGDKTGDEPLSELLKHYLKRKYNKPGNVFLGVVHRIDRPVSGVVIFARTSKSLSRLAESFRNRDVQKTYWAVVKQRPAADSGRLVHFLIKDEKNNRSRAYAAERPGAKRSELEYRLLVSGDNYHLLEIKPLTGRHHQIRVQLAAMGSSIKGDLKYGAERSNRDASIHLHARKAEFLHPVTQTPLCIEAPVPEDKLWKFFEEKALTLH